MWVSSWGSPVFLAIVRSDNEMFIVPQKKNEEFAMRGFMQRIVSGTFRKNMMLVLWGLGVFAQGAGAYYTEEGECGDEGSLAKASFAGGYIGCCVGISHQDAKGDVSLDEFSLESGSEDEDIPPEGILSSTAGGGMGRYFVTHKFSGMEEFPFSGGATSFIIDFRGGYRFAVSQFCLLGIEADFIYRSGHGAQCSTALSGQQGAEFDNFQQGDVLQVPTDVAASQNLAFLSSVDEEDEPLKVVVENQVNFQAFVRNNWIMEISGLMGVVVDKRCLVSVKVGVAFLNWVVTHNVTGEYGSSGYFVDQFSGASGTPPQTISWAWEDDGGPVLKDVEGMSGKYSMWRAGVLIAPNVEVTINPQLSFFLEPKIILPGEALSGEGTLETPHELSVPYSSTFHSTIVIGTMGFRFRL